MYPLSDKDLDRMSREAAEQYDVDQSPSGWERLEHRLDKVLPLQKEKDRKRFLWVFFLFLLAGGSGLVWMLSGEKEKNNIATTKTTSSTKTGNVTPNPLTKPTKGNTTGSNDKNLTRENNTAPATTEAGSNSPAGNKPASLAGNSRAGSERIQPDRAPAGSVSNNKSTGLNPKKNKKSNANGLIVSEVPVRISRKKEAAPLLAEQSNAKVPGNNKKENPVTTTTNTDRSTNQETQQNTIAKSIEPKTTTTDSVPGITKTAIAASSNKKNTAKAAVVQPFAVGLFTGIDFSRINGTGNSKPGYNFGLQVSYAFSKRWSVNTGFLLTKKYYSAMGEDFNPPKHYWTNYVDLTSLEGDCKMWDIPLNVRYNISLKPTTTWFVSTGLSSYIMRKQTYNYYYYINNAPSSKYWETSSQQNEWFQLINISAGFEKTLNRSWSLQAEPFMKLPISGIGFGDMNISSYGLLVGIRYKPILGKNKTTSHSKNP